MPEDGKRSDLGWMPVQFILLSFLAGMFTFGGISLVRDHQEEGKALEAFHYLALVRQAQHRFFDREGTFATDLSKLGLELPDLRYFRAGEIISEEEGLAWSLTLVRRGAWQGYGEYTVTFTDLGFDSARSTIQGFHSINPLAG